MAWLVPRTFVATLGVSSLAENPGPGVFGGSGRLLTLVTNHIRVRDGWREDV